MPFDVKVGNTENVSQENAVQDEVGSRVDQTSILKGKKINPKTGTETSEDDPNGVYKDNLYNNIQLEHAAHTQTQTTPGGAEELASSIKKSEGNDGNVTQTQAKPVTAAGVQNDAARISTSPEEGVLKDGQISQGEKGPEDRTDLSKELGGGSGSNAPQL